MKNTTRFAKATIDRESRNARDAIRGLRDMPQGSIRRLVDVGPKFVRLAIEMIKSPRIKDKARLALAGAVGVLGYSVADQLITRITVFPVIMFLLGPFSALTAMLFMDTVRTILLSASVFIIVKVCAELMDSEEVDKICLELFGEKEGRELIYDVQNAYSILSKAFGPFAEKTLRIFERIGAKVAKKGPIDESGDLVIKSLIENQNAMLKASDTAKADLGRLLDHKEAEQDAAANP